ncbi:MAG: GTPase HflX [Bacteroidales bacterium]|nr:GTPase HflX [Bacteroidales bacterium]
METMPEVRDLERTVLIGLVTRDETEDRVAEYLDELALLVDTAGGTVVHRFLQKLDIPDPRTYVGKGKLDEIAGYAEEHRIDLVVFDDELNPHQMRNISRAIRSKILDRNNLILDIFARRARTAHAKTQVELAQYQYLLPRLAGMWTHLERQRGGIGLRGPGEREIETDRRIVKDKIALLKDKLEKIDRQKRTQRQSRGKMVRVALVGYTNTGKSTLMNLIAKSNILAENKLFATLDTTVRKVVVGNLAFLLSDTVGFLRKLPHSLIESFKSTLDEVREADLLLHVVDISHPDFEDQIAVVGQTLADIHANGKPTLMVFNKIDIYGHNPEEPGFTGIAAEQRPELEELTRSWMARVNRTCLFISATRKKNIDQLRDALYQEVRRIHIQRYPYNDFLF